MTPMCGIARVPGPGCDKAKVLALLAELEGMCHGGGGSPQLECHILKLEAYLILGQLSMDIKSLYASQFH